MEKLISIILPAYNGRDSIGTAIKSVVSQTYGNWELLVIDDGSKDDMEKAVSSFLTDARIRYIKNDMNIGLQKTLNAGISRAKGEFIARIDQDDQWSDVEKLAKQAGFLESNKKYVLVGTDAIIINPEGKKIGDYSMPKTDMQIRDRILSKNCFLHSSIMAKIDAVKKVGLYNESKDAYCVEDYDLWLRLGMIGKMANMDFKGLTITVHPESITAKNRIIQAKNFLAISFKYRNKYPGAPKGLLISALRLLFFKFIALFPISGRFVYKLQALYKSM